MKLKTRNSLTLVLFSLYPLYSFPGILRSIIAREKFGFFLLSLFMGLSGYLLVPYTSMDLTRYYFDFNTIKTLSLGEVINNSSSHLGINVVMWGLSSLGLPKEAMPLIFVTLSYYLRIIILLYILDDYKSAKHAFTGKLFVLVFAFILFDEIRFIGAASGLRNELAFAISLLGLYFLFSRKKTVKGYSFLFLATFMHSSTVIFVIFAFIAKRNIYNKLFRILFIFSLIIIITGTSDIVFYSLMDLMKPYLIAIDAYHPAYFSRDGRWGAAFWSSFNFKTFVLEKYIKPLPFYVAGIYLLVVYKTIIPEYRRFLYLLFITIAVVSVSRTLFDRYNYFATLLFIIMLIIEYRLHPFTLFKKVFLVIFIISLLAVNIANTYKYRDIFSPSWFKMLYLPMPLLLKKSVEPDEYIIRHGGD